MTRKMLLLLSGLAFVIAVFVTLKDRNPAVKYVSVGGSISNEQRLDIYRKLAAVELVEVDIVGLKKELETISWVSRAAVERHWPDGLLISVTPQKAIALWNDDAFISEGGDVFFSSFELAFDLQGRHLAQLYGPKGSEKRVMQQYQQLNRALFKIGQSIEVLTLDDRGAWIFRNDDGIEVMLGKDELMERMRRLLLITELAAFAGRRGEVEKIDTRYSNGIAVSWKQYPDDQRLTRACQQMAQFEQASQNHRIEWCMKQSISGRELATAFKSQRVQKL